MKAILTLLTGLTFFAVSYSPVFADKNKVVVIVNGTKITQKQMDNYVSAIETAAGKKLKDPSQVLDRIINMEVLYQEAKKQKLDQDPKIKFLVEHQMRELYTNALMQKFAAQQKVSDDELKKLYDEQIANKNTTEYQVRHIHFKNETANGEKLAKDVIAQLDTGKDFAKLATEKSEDPSAKNGGQLGWVTIEALRDAPALAQAISELKKGKYSKQPVKSKYGWHVIRIDDIRKKEPIPFEKVKNQLTGGIIQLRVQEYVKSLLAKAKIEKK